MQQCPHTNGLARGALLLVVLTICCRTAEAFMVPTTPAAARAAARAAPSSSSSLPSGLWLGQQGGSGSSRLYARISEKPGDKADREQEGEQGLPVLGGAGPGGAEELPKLTRQQEEVRAEWAGWPAGWLAVQCGRAGGTRASVAWGCSADLVV